MTNNGKPTTEIEELVECSHIEDLPNGLVRLVFYRTID